MKEIVSNIGKINHIAIAVPNIQKAALAWTAGLGTLVSPPQALHEHGVTVAFIVSPNIKVELLEPLGENSPIIKFLRNKIITIIIANFFLDLF